MKTHKHRWKKIASVFEKRDGKVVEIRTRKKCSICGEIKDVIKGRG